MNNKKTILYLYIIILIVLIFLLYYIHLMKRYKDKIEIEEFYQNEDITDELKKITRALNNISSNFENGINIRTVSYPM